MLSNLLYRERMSLISKINGVAEHDFKNKEYGNSIYNNDLRKQK